MIQQVVSKKMLYGRMEKMDFNFFGQKEIKHHIIRRRTVDLDGDSSEEKVIIIPVKEENYIYGERIWMDIDSA